MTPALKAMVEAMRDEFTEQVRHYESARVHERGNPYLHGRASLDELAGGFDLEKVARAGLAAIREPGQEIADRVCDRCNLDDVIDEILKETP